MFRMCYSDGKNGGENFYSLCEVNEMVKLIENNYYVDLFYQNEEGKMFYLLEKYEGIVSVEEDFYKVKNKNVRKILCKVSNQLGLFGKKIC